MRRSLRGRLMLSLSLGLVLCLGALFVTFDGLVDRELYARFDASLANRARAVAVFFGARSDLAALERYLPEFNISQHRDFFQVWDERGRVVARSGASGKADLERPFNVRRSPQHYDVVLPDGHAGRAVAQAFALPDPGAQRTLTVVVAEERDQIDAMEQRLHYILLSGVAVTLLITLSAARLSVTRSLEPLERYASAVAGVDPESGMRAPDSAELPAELLPVAERFSAALNQVLAAVERERRFARDVAHELRTPIAEARALVETGPVAPTPEQYAEQRATVVAALGELEQIVSTLLLMARYESGVEKPMLEPFDLAHELRHQLRRVGAATECKGLTLDISLPQQAWVMVDPVLFARMAANLIDNAVAHAPRGSRIRIELSGPPWRLEICNPAPHLSAGDVVQLGMRFYRAPSASADAHHAGLGLALALTMAHAMALQIVMSLNEGELCAVLRKFVAVEDRADSASVLS